MSQGSLVLPTTGTLPGLTLVQDVNTALDALVTNAAGAAAPTNAQAGAPETGQLWADTSTTPPTMRMYNGSAWVNMQQRTDFLAQQATTPAMSVVVSAGYIPGTATLAGAQTVTIATAPSSPNSRIDLISLNPQTGAYTYTQGTAASSPAAPALPAGTLPCCAVYVGSGVTTITNANITDQRGVSALCAPLYAPAFTGAMTGASGAFSGQLSATTGLFNVLSGGAFSGFVNKFRNGEMLIAKRGTSGSVATGNSSYTLDGWILSSTGATTSWSQGGPLGSTNNSGTFTEALCLVGNSSMTQTSLLQRIESSMAGALAGQTVTLQFTIENNTSAAITPTFQTYYPTAVDNWAGQTADASGTFASIASGATATVAYTFSASTSAYYGYAVYLYFGSALNANTKNVYITGADIRVTPGIATGANSNPPVVERRPIAIEEALNARYLYSTYNNGVGPGTASVASPVITIAQSTITSLPMPFVPFPVRMRANPTTTIYSAGSSGASGKIYNSSASADVNGAVVISAATGAFINVNGVAAISGDLYEVHVFATAEL